MGCFSSRTSKGIENVELNNDSITSNFLKLSQPYPTVWNREIMKSLFLPSIHSPVKKINASQVEELKDLNFSIFSKSSENLKDCLYCMLYSRGYRSQNLRSLIEAISLNYQDNPYHNFSHGFSVCQMLYVLSERNSKFNNYLTDSDDALLLLTGIAHDLNHPGVNNGFMINAKHEIAAKYNNLSVLENYHGAALLEMLSISNFHIEIGDHRREKIISIILGTDMAQHKLVIQSFVENMKAYDKNNEDHRINFMRMMLHGADIGNPALNFQLATVWSLKIIQEFNLQVWKEEQLGLPVSEFMRIGNDIKKIKNSQIVFIDVFIYPLWKTIREFMPNVSELVENIENNRRNWEELENL